MVEPGQRLRFTDEPGPGRFVGVKIHPQPDPSLENQVLCLEQHALQRHRHRALQTIAVAERCVGALEIADRLERAQRSNPRRRSTFASRPHTAALHQRRP
jgi:hypothetical protein